MNSKTKLQELRKVFEMRASMSFREIMCHIIENDEANGVDCRNLKTSKHQFANILSKREEFIYNRSKKVWSWKPDAGKVSNVRTQGHTNNNNSPPSNPPRYRTRNTNYKEIIEISDDEYEFNDSKNRSIVQFYKGLISKALIKFPLELASVEEILTSIKEDESTKFVDTKFVEEFLKGSGSKLFQNFVITKDLVLYGSIDRNETIQIIIKKYFKMFEEALEDIVTGTAESITNFLNSKNQRISLETVTKLLEVHSRDFLAVLKQGNQVSYGSLIKNDLNL